MLRTGGHLLFVNSKLPRVAKAIQREFQLIWFETKELPSKCEDKRALLDALHVLFPRYRGRALRLFRGAAAHEARARKFFGPSWSDSLEEADGFARQYQYYAGGSVVLETMAPSHAIVSAPHLWDRYWLEPDGTRRYDEHEYLVDGRRLRGVRVLRRYPQMSIEALFQRRLPSESS